MKLGEVTTVNMRFDLPSGTPPPPCPRLQSIYNMKGAEYVWHCHIQEHEEHDMMHTLVVTLNLRFGRAGLLPITTAVLRFLCGTRDLATNSKRPH